MTGEIMHDFALPILLATDLAIAAIPGCQSKVVD
jgi:hypothetical protein